MVIASNGESAPRKAFAYAFDVEPISALFTSPITKSPSSFANCATSLYTSSAFTASKKAELIFIAGANSFTA